MQLTRVVQTTPCVRFVRNVHKSMYVWDCSNARMDVKGHDSHNTNRLRIVAARPGFVDTRFDIGEENRA